MHLSYEFQIGEPVNVKELNIICNIEKELGSGTQGKVYSLICPDNSALVLKWYFPSMATMEQFEILDALVKKESPSDRFLWPLALVTLPNKQGFGYVMALKDQRFKSFSTWLSRKIDPSFKVLFTACFELAQSFHFLHSQGICYRDLSLNNIYFDPKTGEIRIGDTDNIVVNGENKGTVLGTPKFMAPEIITGKSLPNTQSDLFSLAVILFYILFLNHPLEGKKESSIKSLDLPAMSKLYGFDPIFIFDPDNTSNYPDPIYHKNALIFWEIYPDLIKKMFIRAFTSGIIDPVHGRVRETEWQTVLIAMRDFLVYCTRCGSENFVIPNELNEVNRSYLSIQEKNNASAIGNLNLNIITHLNSTKSQCWNERCGSTLQKPYYIKIDEKMFINLNHDTKLFAHHIDYEKRYDFSKPVAEVSKHPNNPSIWGLKNLSNNIWYVKTIEGETIEIESQKSVSLVPGTLINFGKTEGIISY